MRLNGSVRLRKPINTICLPDRFESFRPGQRCVIAGWGKTSWNGQTSPVLREAWIDLVSRETCNAKEYVLIMVIEIITIHNDSIQSVLVSFCLIVCLSRVLVSREKQNIKV